MRHGERGRVRAPRRTRRAGSRQRPECCSRGADATPLACTRTPRHRPAIIQIERPHFTLPSRTALFAWQKEGSSMRSTNFLEKSVSALSDVQHMLSQHPPLAAGISPLTITIAREAGTTGTGVGHEVGSRLGWEVYDHELLERMARDMGRRVALLEQVDERRQSWMRDIFNAWGQVASVNESWYA